MKPQEKAKQLFDLFDRIPRYAKRAVDEIIIAGKDVDEFSDSYWQEVKQEIEKL